MRGTNFRSHPHGDDVKCMTPEEVIKGLSIGRKKERPHVHGPGPLAEHSVTLNSSHTLPRELLHT